MNATTPPEIGLLDSIALALIEKRLPNETGELIMALLEGTDADVDAAMNRYCEWRESRDRERFKSCPRCADGTCGRCDGYGRVPA